MSRLTLITEVPFTAFSAGYPCCLPGELAVIGDHCDQHGERTVRIFRRISEPNPCASQSATISRSTESDGGNFLRVKNRRFD